MSFSCSSAGKESTYNAGRRPWFNFWVRKVRWRMDRLPTAVFFGFPGGSAGKESACNVGNLGSIPGLGRSPAEGDSYTLQYSGLENSIDCIVHGVEKSPTWLSDLYFHFIITLPGMPSSYITFLNPIYFLKHPRSQLKIFFLFLDYQIIHVMCPIHFIFKKNSISLYICVCLIYL